MVLYELEDCPFCERLRLALQLHEIRHERRHIRELGDQGVTQANPLAEAPVMQVDGAWMFDSMLIAADLLAGQVCSKDDWRVVSQCARLWDGTVVPAWRRSVLGRGLEDPERRRALASLRYLQTHLPPVFDRVGALVVSVFGPHVLRMDFLKDHGEIAREPEAWSIVGWLLEAMDRHGPWAVALRSVCVPRERFVAQFNRLSKAMA